MLKLLGILVLLAFCIVWVFTIMFGIMQNYKRMKLLERMSKDLEEKLNEKEKQND